MPKITNWSKKSDDVWVNEKTQKTLTIVSNRSVRTGQRWYEVPLIGNKQYDTKETARKAAVNWMRDHSANIYRVWLSGEAVSGGRREVARYRANDLDQVVDVVKKEEFKTIPDDLQEEWGGEGRIYLIWSEKISQEDAGVSDEEYKEMEQMMGENYLDYAYEIEKDNSATYPMEVVTGGTAGRDLTR